MNKNNFKKFHICAIIFVTIITSFIFCSYFSLCYANTDIKSDSQVKIECSVKNAFERFSNTYNYKIESVPSNPKGAVNEPTSLNIEFNEQTNVINDDIITNSSIIDFSNVKYRQTGIYKYIVSEIGSSNRSRISYIIR